VGVSREVVGLGRDLRRVSTGVWRRVTKPKAVDLDGVTIPMDVGAMNAAARYGVCFGDYEREERALLAETVEPGDVVLELGTGLGVISTLAAQLVGPTGSVHSFEANPRLEDDIRRVYAANGVAPDFHAYPLGAEERDLELFVSSNFFSSSTVDHGQEATKVVVHQRPIAEVVERLRPTYLIMDVEGAEVELVPAVDMSSIRKVLLEVHPHKVGPGPVSEVVASLLDRGLCLDTRRSARDVLYFFRPPADGWDSTG
jgi:FkbM family methyltransferase